MCTGDDDPEGQGGTVMWHSRRMVGSMGAGVLMAFASVPVTAVAAGSLPATVVLSSAPTPQSSYGQDANLTAVVSGTGATPTGTVTFVDTVGGTLGAAPL